MVQRMPDAEVRFFWDPRRKKWAVTVWTQSTGVATGYSTTTAAIDETTKHLLLKAVVDEMDRWLEF